MIKIMKAYRRSEIYKNTFLYWMMNIMYKPCWMMSNMYLQNNQKTWTCVVFNLKHGIDDTSGWLTPIESEGPGSL